MSQSALEQEAMIWMNFKNIFIGATLVLLAAGCGLATSNEDRLLRASEAYTSGEYRSAIIDTKRVLRDEPQNLAARILLGRVSVAVGDGVTAEKELRRAIEFGADRQEVLVSLVRSLLIQGKFEQALEEVNSGPTAADIDRAEILRLQGDALIGLARAEGAREKYVELLGTNPGEIDAHLGIVRSYLLEGNVIQARENLSNVLIEHEGNIVAHLMSGGMYYDSGQFERAELDFRAALRSAEDNTESANRILALIGLVESLLVQDKIDEARQFSAQLLKIAPDNISANFIASRIAYIDEDWEETEARLQYILAKAPDFRAAQQLLGAVHLRGGNLGQANMYLSAVIAAAPNNIDARILLAETLLRQNKVKEAAEIIGPAVSRVGVDSETLALAARINLAVGDFDVATEALFSRAKEAPNNSGYQLDLAAAYIVGGQLEEAADVLEFLADSEDVDRYRKGFLTVLAMIRSGDFSASVVKTNDLISEWPEDSRLRSLAGRIELSTGATEKARAHFEEARRLAPDDALPLLNLGHLAVVEGDFATAKEYFNEADEMHPDGVSAKIELARLALSTGDDEEALRWAELTRKSGPTSYRSWLTLAQVYLAVKQFENAELMAEQAATVGGGQSDPFSLMAQAQIGAGRSEDALVSISKAAKVDPEDRAIKLNLAELQMRAGDRAAAKETLATIDSSLMDDLVAGARLVVLQFELGDLDLAIRGAKELARRFPDSGIPHVLLGEFYYGAERFPAAVREFNTAMDINLTEPIAVRAYMQMLRHDLSNPTAPLDRLLKKEPDNYRVRMMVAEYYQRRAKHEVAIEQYETVIRQNPESWIAMNNLSISYLARGRPEALAMAKRAFELAPDNNSVMDTYGWVLFKNGAVEEGLKILQEVSGKSSGNSEIQFHLAQALAETGQTNEAKLILDQILVAGNEFSSRKEAQHLLESIQ